MTKATRPRRSATDDPTEATDRKLRNTVQSLAKGFRVLEAFTADNEELSLSEIALSAGLDPGTTFRMLNTLVELGYLSRVPESRRFRLTLKVLDLGFHAIARSDMRSVVRPVLRSLVGDVNEAASFAVLQGPDVLYLERVRAGITRLGVDIRIGTTVSTVRTVVGRTILAFLSAAEIARVTGLDPTAGNAETDELAAGLARIREDGHAVLDSQLTEGLRILAVPVLDADRYPLGAISVAAPSIRCTPEELRATALEPTLAAAHDIARAMQARGSIAVTPSRT
ncbi:IclR family transcriptional regulator [Luteimonas huabeiensis]|uniref:IclR family transcriptional regulator n=1 Tax=Luteimonas huabeiensis TaxID=1244513 RepID=UPI000464B29D|nr:IclR family transcriptional regulator [Luteimonas huabeiensis]